MRALAVVAAGLVASPAAAETLVDVDERAPCRAVHAAKAPGCWRHVRLRADRIELVTPIAFEYGKAELGRIEVQGHNGFDESHRSMRLSAHRARAVMNALVYLGVDPVRLEAKGYGESVPLVMPRTVEDRRRNTRIELHVAR